MSPAFLDNLTAPDFKAVASQGCFVYCYLRSTCGTPYYVGIAKHYLRPRKQHTCIIPKDFARVRVLRHSLSWAEACQWERFYIKRFGRKDLGTGILRNMTDGGDGAHNPGPQVRAGMSARCKNRRHTPEARAKVSAANKGKILSAETRARISLGRKGKGVGVPLSAEHRANLSAAHKGLVKSPETRAKLRAAGTGRVFSPERCANISAAKAAKGAAELGMSIEDYSALSYAQRYRRRQKLRDAINVHHQQRAAECPGHAAWINYHLSP